jgi:hypothetical protein
MPPRKNIFDCLIEKYAIIERAGRKPASIPRRLQSERWTFSLRGEISS